MSKIIYASISGSILEGQIPILSDSNFTGISTSSLRVTNAISSSWASTASFLLNNPATSSWAMNAVTSSYAISASYAATASSANDFRVRGDLVSSGNTYLGDTLTDTHNLSGSVNIHGSGSSIFKVIGSNGDIISVSDDDEHELLTILDQTGSAIYVVHADRYSILNSSTWNNISNTQVIYAITSSIASAGFFDYYIKNSTASRAGSIHSIWSGSNVEMNDICTNDLGGTTNAVTFSMDISSSYTRLICGIASGSWTLKISARLL